MKTELRGQRDAPLTVEQRALLGSAVGQRTIAEVKRFIMAMHAKDVRIDASELESIIHEQLVLAVRDFDPSRPGGLASFRSYAGRYVHKRVLRELHSSRYRRDPVEVPASALGLGLEELSAIHYPEPMEVRYSDIGDEDKLDALQREGFQRLSSFSKKQYQRYLAVAALTAASPSTPEELVARDDYILWLRRELKEVMAQLAEERDREVLHERFWLDMTLEAIGRRRRPPVGVAQVHRMLHIAFTELGYLMRIRGTAGTAREGPT